MDERPFVIGSVAGTHGLKGDIKVFPLTDDIRRFELLKEINIETNVGSAAYGIERVRYGKKFVIIKLYGINTIDNALPLKGGRIKIEAKDALPLSEDEYYIRDLLEMDVYTEEGGFLGKITDVATTGANDVYEVDKKLYIPAIKECIINVDIENKRMEVRLLEGLLD